MRYSLTVLLCVAMVLLAGYIYENREPQVIIQTEYIEVIDEVRVPNYIIVSEPEFIEYPVYIEVEKEVPQLMRHFGNMTELKDWLDSKPIIVPSWESGDCEDFARMLQEEAYEDGYYLSVTWAKGSGKMHCDCLAFVGDLLVEFEPQNHKIVYTISQD